MGVFFRLALHWQILIGMLVGAGAGVALNVAAGTRTTTEPIPVEPRTIQLRGMDVPAEIRAGQVWIQDSPNQTAIQLSEFDQPTGRYRTRRAVVGPDKLLPVAWPPPPPQVDQARPIPRENLPTLGDLGRRDPAAFALFRLHGRSPARRVGDVADEIGGLFLRLLRMVSIPLVITSLITGVTGLGQAERLGKMFGRTLVYYVATSMLAILVGLSLVNLIRPGVRGDGATLAGAEAAEDAVVTAAAEGKGLGIVLLEQLESMIPANPFASLAEGNFLSIIAFSIAVGIFATLAGGRTAEVVSDLASAGFQVMMRMTMAIIFLAPIGVLFLMLSATATQGLGVFTVLGLYMVTVALALLLHAAVTLPLVVKLVARRSPGQFFQAMSPALLTAFSSASSNATLPLTITCAEERAGISNRVTSFVLPLGATVNMDGTALYEVIAVLFIAQLTGYDLTLAQQMIVVVTALLASIGAAGIPHAGLVMMVIILQAVGLPLEAQGMIIAVDRILDMARTSVNVWSDSCGCAVISRFEVDGEMG